MSDMTEQDANKLFNEISQAIKDTDANKLSELTSQAPEEKEEQSTEVDELEKDNEQEAVETDLPEGDKEEDEKTPSGKDQTEKTDEEDKKEGETDEQAELRKQLEAVKRENHALRSQAGRVPYVQRRLKELDEKLAKLEAERTATSSQASAKIKPEVDALLKDLSETDATLADTIRKALEAATNGMASELHERELSTLKLMRDQEAVAYQEMEAQRLLEQFPNAREVFVSPHWSEWKKKQSDGIRALAESTSADDVAYAFRKYAEDMQKAYPELAQQSQPKVETGTDEAREKAKKVEEERRKRKENSANVGSPNAAGKVAMPDDPEALFKKYSEQIRKQRTG